MKDSFHMGRFVSRQRTTTDTLKKAKAKLQQLLDGKEVSSELREFLVRELDNNLKFLTNLNVLTPDSAIWQCVKSTARRTFVDEYHQVVVYCHGKWRLKEWRQPANRRNERFPDQSIKEVINAKYTETDDSVIVHFIVIKKDPEVPPIPFEETFEKNKRLKKTHNCIY